VHGYVVERARGAREPTRLGQVTATTFRDHNASEGVSYTYRVRAENPEGLSAPSGDVRARSTQTPDAPAVSAQGGDGELVVQWRPPEDTGGLDVTAYRVFAYAPGSDADLERCASACWGKVSNTTTRATIGTVQDEPVENGDSYEVRVQARNANGWGPPSDPSEATARPVPDAPTQLLAQADDGESRSVHLEWTAPDDEVDGFAVYRGPALDELSRIATTSETEWRDEDEVPQGQPVLYAVAARADGAESPLSATEEIVFATPPSEVADLSARWTGSHVEVAWSSPNETGGSPIQTYEVARTEGAMDPEEAEADVHRTAVERYRDSSPPRGKPVTYHVRAVTEAGEGPWEFEQVRVPLTQDSRPPVPALAAHPTKLDPGDRVVFDASGSQDDEDIVAYNFSFGDGQGTGWQSTPRVRHTYDERGVFDATVTVRDASGLQASSEATIAVGPPQGETNSTVNESVGDPVGGTQDTPLGLAAALAGLSLAAIVARRT
jgi:fibronectin type 3 domain-containing protein